MVISNTVNAAIATATETGELISSTQHKTQQIFSFS